MKEVKKYSRVRADINLDAVDHNFEVMHSRLKPNTKMCAVVKADCYGHGALQIARFVQDRDYIWGYACATAEEAMALRNGGIMKPIILLGYAFPESYEDLIDYDIRACVFEAETAEELSKMAQMLGKTALVHLAVDTGMSRIGFIPSRESVRVIKGIAELPGLKIEGLFTHFARADEKSMAPAEEQFSRYRAFSEALENEGVQIPIHHVSNSAALMRRQDMNLNMVRPGITIYGLTPSDDIGDEILPELIPVMSLVSHISYIKTLPAGQAVSYGGTYVTKRPTKVATVPVGYADGYPRTLSNKGSVLIGGKRAPIIGRICMDQFMVDITDVEGVAPHDEVVLLGSQGSEHITAEELGNLSGRFNYELVCDITKRVPRNYLLHGVVLEQADHF